MSDYAIKSATFGRHEAKPHATNFGSVQGDDFAAFTGLEGKSVRCTSGYLWVTLESNRNDHILSVDKSLSIPDNGKVIIGGKGNYSIEARKRMPLAS